VKKKQLRKKTGVVTKATRHEDALFARVVDIIEAARGHVTRSVNTAMVQAYWLIGREIVEVEQRGEKRADYGARVIAGLAKRLAGRVGKGFSVPNLRNMRQFYLTYPEGSALPGALGGAASPPEKRSALPSVSASSKIRSAAPSESRTGTRAASPTIAATGPAPFPPYLGWTHYLILMRVANPTARAFYEIEAAARVGRAASSSARSRRSCSSASRRAATRRRSSRSHGADTRSRCRPTC
jgi:hypothetical protein